MRSLQDGLIENNRKSAVNNKRKVTGSRRNGQKSQLALCAGCVRLRPDLINVHFTVGCLFVLPQVGGGGETQFTPTRRWQYLFYDWGFASANRYDLHGYYLQRRDQN